MYASEPCVKFPCESCQAWITAAHVATEVVCPWCARGQEADAERMRHFSLNGRTILLGRDEWLPPEAAERRLLTERVQVEQWLERSSAGGSTPQTSCGTAQLLAIDAAIALCRRLAAE